MNAINPSSTRRNGKMVTSMVNPQKENGTTVILTVDSQQESFIVIGKT